MIVFTANIFKMTAKIFVFGKNCGLLRDFYIFKGQ